MHGSTFDFGCNSLVDGVLQVLLQPPDLWVHTHLFVCLQLGTDEKKKRSVSANHASTEDERVIYAKSVTLGVLTHCYQTDWISTGMSVWLTQSSSTRVSGHLLTLHVMLLHLFIQMNVCKQFLKIVILKFYVSSLIELPNSWAAKNTSTWKLRQSLNM